LKRGDPAREDPATRDLSQTTGPSGAREHPGATGSPAASDRAAFRRVLVLGATGAIGAHAVRACLARGWPVRAFVRPASGRQNLAGLDLEIAEGDARAPAALADAFRGCDAFVHAAGFYPTSGLAPARAVVEALASVRDVFQAAASEGVRRGVYVSSASTLGSDSGAPTAHSTGGPYHRAKEAMERLARARAADGLPLVIVNPTLCLGEYDRKPSSGRLVLEVARGRAPVYVQAPVNVVYTGDVGRGIAAALVAGRIGERHALAGDDTTVKWLVRQIAYEAGAPMPRLRIPLAAARAGARIADARARARGEPAFAGIGVVGRRHAGRVGPTPSNPRRRGRAPRGRLVPGGRDARSRSLKIRG
jgi:dihydroflavonol-4-reductase